MKSSSPVNLKSYHFLDFYISSGYIWYFLLLSLIITITSGYCTNACAQNVSVSSRIDSSEMLIGDHLPLTLEVSHDESTSVFWPVWLDSIGRMEILFSSSIDSSVNGGIVTKTQTVYITAFDSGEYQIPPINFYYSSDYSNDTLQKSTSALNVFVHTVPVDTSQAIKPIKSIQDIPVTFREILPWVVIVSVLLLIIGGVIYWNYLRKKRKPEMVPAKKPVVPPHEIAMKKLGELEQKKLWQEGRVKEYYIELTEIIREYIEGRFSVLAMESTTYEILNELRTKDLEESQRAVLRDLLERADLTKFAKFKPGPEENRNGMEVARQFVQATKKIIIDEESPEKPVQQV